MKNRSALAVPALLSAALLSTGCVEQTVSRYPSLQPRAIERRSDAEPTQVTIAAATDPALDQMLAEHAKTLADADAGFPPVADAAERAAKAARGDGAGGDRWIAAQTALARLDAFRATTSTAVTDLDEIAIARARDGKPPYPALESLKSRGDAQLAAQVDRIATIQKLLPGG